MMLNVRSLPPRFWMSKVDEPVAPQASSVWLTEIGSGLISGAAGFSRQTNGRVDVVVGNRNGAGECTDRV